MLGNGALPCPRAPSLLLLSEWEEEREWKELSGIFPGPVESEAGVSKPLREVGRLQVTHPSAPAGEPQTQAPSAASRRSHSESSGGRSLGGAAQGQQGALAGDALCAGTRAPLPAGSVTSGGRRGWRDARGALLLLLGAGLPGTRRHVRAQRLQGAPRRPAGERGAGARSCWAAAAVSAARGAQREPPRVRPERLRGAQGRSGRPVLLCSWPRGRCRLPAPEPPPRPGFLALPSL